jgi:hypothetical protein
LRPQRQAAAGGVICPTLSPIRVSQCCRVVLNSERAIEVNIAIMRAFVKLRDMLQSNEDLNRKFAAVIRKLATHDKYFTVVFDELKKLNEQPTRPRKQIGFKTAS